MPFLEANGISLSYTLHSPPSATPKSTSTSTPKHPIVLINGLADSQLTWSAQVPSFLFAGHAVLTFDNRGIGASSAPPGPYSARMLAQDCHALVMYLNLHRAKFHLVGVSMGGMIAQTYAIEYPEDLLSLTLACTYAAPGPFCGRMFSLWAEMAPVHGVRFVMRDVTLWAFTQGFFEEERAEELEGVEREMAALEMGTEAYLAQLEVIRKFDERGRVGRINVRTMVLAGEEDILIPVGLSKRLHGLVPGSRWRTVKGGHACLWEWPEGFNEAVLGFVGNVEREGDGGRGGGG